MKNSVPYIAGFICGLLMVALAGFIISKLAKKNKMLKKINTEYDERQLIAQSSAWKWGFWTLVFYGIINGAVMDVYRWADNTTAGCVGVFIATFVFALICIIKDAYTPLNQNMKQYVWLFLGIGVLNIAIGIINFKYGGLTENGMLTVRSISFMAAGLIFIIDIIYIVDYFIKRKRDKQDEESEA